MLLSLFQTLFSTKTELLQTASVYITLFKSGWVSSNSPMKLDFDVVWTRFESNFTDYYLKKPCNYECNTNNVLNKIDGYWWGGAKIITEPCTCFENENCKLEAVFLKNIKVWNSTCLHQWLKRSSPWKINKSITVSKFITSSGNFIYSHTFYGPMIRTLYHNSLFRAINNDKQFILHNSRKLQDKGTNITSLDIPITYEGIIGYVSEKIVDDK